MMERYYQEHSFSYIFEWFMENTVYYEIRMEVRNLLYNPEMKKRKASMEQSWKSKYNLNNEEK